MFSLELNSPIFTCFSAVLKQFADRLRKPLTLGLCLMATGSIVSCDGDSGRTGELRAGQLSLSLPDRIRNVTAINPNAVVATATVNDLQYQLSRGSDGRYQTSVAVSANSAISVSVSFSETLPGGTVLDLASHPAIERNTGDSNLTLQFFDNNYQTSGFDLDGDGCSNIVEREAETDPLTDDAVPPGFKRSVFFDLPSNIPNPDLTGSILTIAEIRRVVDQNGVRFASTGAVSPCLNSKIDVILTQRFNGSTLVVATASVAHGTNPSVQLNDSDFNFNEDADGDGRTNVTELQNGTNPFVRD